MCHCIVLGAVCQYYPCVPKLKLWCRERLVGGSPVRDGQSGVPWDIPGSMLMQPILEGAPNSTDAADAASARPARPNAPVVADATGAVGASREEGAGTWPQVGTAGPANSGTLLPSLSASPGAAEAVAAGTATAAGLSAAAAGADRRAEGGAVRDVAAAVPAVEPSSQSVDGSLVQAAGARSIGEPGSAQAAFTGGLQQHSDVAWGLQSGEVQPKGKDRASRAGIQCAGMASEGASLLGSGSPAGNTSTAAQSWVSDSSRSIQVQPGMSSQAVDTSAYSGSKHSEGFSHEPSFSQLSGQPSAGAGSTIANTVRPAVWTSGGTDVQALAPPEFSFLAKGSRDLQLLSAPVTSIGGRSGTKRSGKRKAAAASGPLPYAVVPGSHGPDQDAVLPDDTRMVSNEVDSSQNFMMDVGYFYMFNLPQYQIKTQDSEANISFFCDFRAPALVILQLCYCSDGSNGRCLHGRGGHEPPIACYVGLLGAAQGCGWRLHSCYRIGCCPSCARPFPPPLIAGAGTAPGRSGRPDSARCHRCRPAGAFTAQSESAFALQP